MNPTPALQLPYARIDPMSLPGGDHRCTWCNGIHDVPEPHEGMRPGARFDPTLRSRSRDDEEQEPTVGRWFHVTTADLVDPSGYRANDWEALETLAWMCRAAARPEFRADRGQQVWDVLRGQPSCTGATGPLALGGPDWPAQVRKCLGFAILCQSAAPVVQAWRQALGIAYSTERLRIVGPTIRPYTQKASDRHQPDWGQMKGRLTGLLALRGALAWSLNTSHADAVVIQQIRLHLGSHASVDLSYGIDSEPCASSWSVTLAAQAKGEPLLSVIDRAGAALGQLLDRQAKSPLIDRWRAGGGTAARPAPWTVETIAQIQQREAARGRLARTVQTILVAHHLDPYCVAERMRCSNWGNAVRQALAGEVSSGASAERISQAVRVLGLTAEEGAELLAAFGFTPQDPAASSGR
jgi:hypothetical protein